jgi:hypothetical protein
MIATIFFILFSYLSGYLEAYFWASRPKVKQLPAHAMLTLVRTCVLVPIVWYEGIWSFVFCVFMFPFIHDGAYYTTRNNINPNVYKKRWFDSSLTTGAIISFNAFERTAFAIIGLSTFIIYNILKIY